MEIYLPYDGRADSLAIAKSFFNSIRKDIFLECLEQILDRERIFLDDNGCAFEPETDEPFFEGVKFYTFEDDIVVNEETYRSIMLQACAGFARLYPEKRGELETLLKRYGFALPS